MTGMRPDWIAVDAGAARRRAWAMGPEGPLAEAATPQAGGEFELGLLRLIWPWLSGDPVPVVACGVPMPEVASRAVPCVPVAAAGLVSVPVRDGRISLRVVPGLVQSEPADLMCGDETRIAGALALLRGFDGVLCLPGPQTRWVQVSAGEVVGFRSFLSGDLFDLLAGKSLLRDAVSGGGWDAEAFPAAVQDGMAHPQKLGSKLYALQAQSQLQGLLPGTARARLAGFLIGQELAGARGWWLGQSVVVVGPDDLAARYIAALGQQGATPRALSAEACTLAGLAVAHGQLAVPVR